MLLQGRVAAIGTAIQIPMARLWIWSTNTKPPLHWKKSSDHQRMMPLHSPIGLPVEGSPMEKSRPDSCGVCFPKLQLYSSQSYSPSLAATSMQQFQSAALPAQKNKLTIILFAFGHPLLLTERHKPLIILILFGRGFYAIIRALAPRYALLSVRKNKLPVLLSALVHGNEQQV